MGKRSDFPKIEKDAYMTTDPRAVRPLKDYYDGIWFSYYEPCVGNGDLVNLLSDVGNCVGKSDIELDARTTHYKTKADYFVTNPPMVCRDFTSPYRQPEKAITHMVTVLL